MGKSTSVKREIRFQQWIQQVKEYNERPDGMSMSAWCKSRGIAQSTFATRLQKVQDRCLESCQISAESSELSVLSEPAMPAFVELPVATYSCKDKPAAVISCPNFKIEISESVSEAFLPALIHEQNTDSVISHLNYTIIINFVDNTSEKLEIFSFSEVLSTVKMPIG